MGCTQFRLVFHFIIAHPHMNADNKNAIIDIMMHLVPDGLQFGCKTPAVGCGLTQKIQKMPVEQKCIIDIEYTKHIG